MSVLRLLSSSHANQSAAGSSSRPLDEVKLKLRLPTFGTVYMKPPDDPLWPHGRSAGPRDDQLLNGVLEVHIPNGMGPRRCKSIRVGARTKSMLHLGVTRGWEEDVIFERKVEILGANADGIVLDEGIQRFEFTLILPSTFAPHDWHKNGKVRQELYAEMEGIAPPTPSPLANIFRRPASLSSSKRGSLSSSSRTPSRSPSPKSSPRYSPLNLSPMLTAAASLSITRQEEVTFPLVPSYEESQADAKGMGREKDDWITGVHEFVRNITVLHNPNPAGNFSDLDERQNGFGSGIGAWDLKIFSDVFSIGGPIHARLTLPDLDPKSTIFSWRLHLEQMHTISSPRDDPDLVKPISHTVVMDIMERGSRPPMGIKHPGIEYPAMWRGSEAGGADEGECLVQGNAFMPKDDRARPTTLPGIITPIKVSHALVYEVYFSVWGEDDQGGAMAKPGPGGLRVLRVKKPIILPSCGLIPTLLDLPQYSQVQSGGPCPDCGTRPGDQICLTCPPTTVPHVRHDPDFRKSRCGTGRCQTCSIRFAPCLAPEAQNYCACGLGIEDIEMRMKKFAFEGVRTDFERERITRQKEIDERGRRRDRSGSRPRR